MDGNEGILLVIAKQVDKLKREFAKLWRVIGKLFKKGVEGAPGKKGGKGDRGRRGAKGDRGKDGKDGKKGYSVRGPEGPQGDKGDAGDLGPMPKHEWKGTSLRFETASGEWGKRVDLRGPAGRRSGVVIGSSGDAWDPTDLPAANDSLPDEFIVKQDGLWVRASYEQMQTWLGGSGGGEGIPANVVTIGGIAVTVT